jgi:hypothetical protein
MACERRELRAIERGAVRDDALRRLEIYRKKGLFGEGDPEIAYKRASSAAEWIAALELVHDCYVGCGYIRPHSSAVRARTYDLCPETGVYIALREGRVVGSLSTVLDTADLFLPSDRFFPDELDGLRATGAVVGELSNLAIVPALRNTAVFTELTRCNAAHALHVGQCTDLVCAISPVQQPFFELLGFALLGSRRSCSDEIDDNVVLMHLAQIQSRWSPRAPFERSVDPFLSEFFLGGNRFVPRIDGWNDEVRAMFDDAGELADLVSACREIVTQLRPGERAALRRRLGRAYIDAADAPLPVRSVSGAYGQLARTVAMCLDDHVRRAS